MDTVGDFLTILRNAGRAKKKTCLVMASKLRAGILKILQSEGYIVGFSLEEDAQKRCFFLVVLKYVQGVSVMMGLERCSKPGCRLYCDKGSIPRVLGGLGTVILSTSRGILRGSEAVRLNVGGEVLCKVW